MVVARTDGQPGGLEARLAQQDQEIASLCGEVLERYEEATFIYRLSERIGSLLGERAIADLVLRDAAALLGANSGEVWLAHDDALALVASLPACPGKTPALPVVEAVATGLPWADETARGDRAEAVVALPDGRGGALGALRFGGRPAGRGYLTGEVKLMTTIAALAAAFIRNDRLAATERHAELRRRDDEIALEVHRGLLPRQDPLFAGLDIAGGCRSAERVGGDYYGYMAMADGSLGVAIADVSGHGVGAALYMATAKGALESEAREILSPSDLLHRVNEVLASDFSAADMFATMMFARFLPDGRRLVWSNAGHNAPLLLRAGGAVESLPASGPAVGILSGARWRDGSVRFEDGDLLLVFTDGVVETRDVAGRAFGTERLVEAARRHSGRASEVKDAILEDLRRHGGGTLPKDDVTLLVIRGTRLAEPA